MCSFLKLKCDHLEADLKVTAANVQMTIMYPLLHFRTKMSSLNFSQMECFLARLENLMKVNPEKRNGFVILAFILISISQIITIYVVSLKLPLTGSNTITITENSEHYEMQANVLTEMQKK